MNQGLIDPHTARMLDLNDRCPAKLITVSLDRSRNEYVCYKKLGHTNRVGGAEHEAILPKVGRVVWSDLV